jgi:pyridoxamine 5'-phosphate oxidase-like protein
VSRRQQIEMTEAEVREFLDEKRVVVCATNGPRGWPHLMPLWFVVRPPELWTWTYAKSQKTRNLERDPRATLQLEDGVEYAELRGVMLECDVVVHRDVDVVTDLGLEIFSRYTSGGGEVAAGIRDMVRAQAPKRVGMQFIERRRATWDHRKLGGVY